MQALLIIDWQKEYIDEKSDYYVHSDLKQETLKLNKLIKSFRVKNSPIIFVRHNETEGTNFLKGSANSQLIESLDINESDIVIDKYQISSFYNTELENILKEKGVTELYILGILTNLCVRSAVSDAYDRGYDIKIIENLCISLDAKIQSFTLKDLVNTRPEIQLVNSTGI